jgi:hypothetical protein
VLKVIGFASQRGSGAAARQLYEELTVAFPRAEPG